MRCNLIKVPHEYEDKSSGKQVKFYRFYLVFDNDVRIPITCQYYDVDDIKDEKKKQQLQIAKVFQTIS